MHQSVKLSIYWSIYGHELWVVTKQKRCQIQVAEMSFRSRLGHTEGQAKELSHCHWGAWSRSAAPPHRDGPAQLAQLWKTLWYQELEEVTGATGVASETVAPASWHWIIIVWALRSQSITQTNVTKTMQKIGLKTKIWMIQTWLVKGSTLSKNFEPNYFFQSFLCVLNLHLLKLCIY